MSTEVLRVVVVTHLESFTFLVRPPRMGSISPERHHHRASLRQAELNPREVYPFTSTWPSLLVTRRGCVSETGHATTPEIFNFFSERVRSAPEFTFPPHPPEAPPSQTTQTLSPGILAHRHNDFCTVNTGCLHFSPVDRWDFNAISGRHTSFRFSLDGQTGEVAGGIPQEDGGDGDNAEKPRILCLVVLVRSCGLNGDDCFGS